VSLVVFRVFEGSSSISSLDPLQIVSNTTLAHSHLQLPTPAGSTETLRVFLRSQDTRFPLLSLRSDVKLNADDTHGYGHYGYFNASFDIAIPTSSC
jgi:hypothetical protein